MDIYVYDFFGKLYINLTNKCSNSCEFCLRDDRDEYGGNHLWIKNEPSFDEVLQQLNTFDLTRYGEVTFCGYGEPTYRLDVLLEVAEYVHSLGKKTRLNTNGQSDLINGGKTAHLLKGKIDTVSISLNNGSAAEYDNICHSIFGEEGYSAMLDFAADCVKNEIYTVMSVVDVIPPEEIERCRTICTQIGANFRIRAKE